MNKSKIKKSLKKLKEKTEIFKNLCINPDDPCALRKLGISMQKKGDFDKALEYYNYALENSEEKEVEYTLIGTIYYLKEELDEAVKYFELGIEENEHYEPAYEGRNQALLENQLKLIELQENLISRYSN